jgi:hypothetical protein
VGDPYPESTVRKRTAAAYFSSPRAKGIDPRANWANKRRRPQASRDREAVDLGADRDQGTVAEVAEVAEVGPRLNIDPFSW